MRALLVARKNLLEMAREWQLLGLVILLPLAFLAITAFGYSSPLLVTHPVWVVDSGHQGAALIEQLRTLRYADGRPIFDFTQATDRDAVETALKEQTATALMTVAGDGSKVTIRGDPLYGRFYRASTILESAINRYADGLAGRPEVVRLAEEPLGAASPQSEFDVYAPGMMIFALLLIIPQTAMLVAREMRWKTLHRLRLACLRAWELLAGVSIAQMVVAVIQVAVIFVAAVGLGFHNQGSLWLAFVVGLVVSFSAVGMGLVVACFVEDDSQAINVGSTVTMLQVFLSGSFFQLPPLTVFTLAGHQIDLFDIFPATHGFLAVQQVLSYGAGLREVSFRLGMALALSVLYFGVGVAVFQRLQMKEQV